MLTVIFLLTAAVVMLVQVRMRAHIREDLVSSLRAESLVHSEVERSRSEQAIQGVALIADQPTLKALMSTNDWSTVQDASSPILQTSHADLLVLENPAGTTLAFHAKSSEVGIAAVRQLMQDSNGAQDWWFVGGRLFEVSFAPIVAGAGAEKHGLGRIALGRDVSLKSVGESAAFQNSVLTFERQGAVLLSSLPKKQWAGLEAFLRKPAAPADAIQEVTLDGERYLTSFVELPGDHPVRLYSLQSYDQAASFLQGLNRMLLILGVVAVLSGALIVFGVSRQITRPLENLVEGTHQLEKGDFDFQISARGEDEVASLTRAFDEMRQNLRQSREGMVRAARLEAVGRLAGGVAHDFNNLVMIIRGYSDLLLDSSTAEARPHIEEIKRAGERASALTRQLLAFSRKQVLEPQVLDPNQTISNMAKMLRVLIGEDVELATNFSQQIGHVQVDPGQLEQVIMNLAVNARDAMPDGGKLVIETQPCHVDSSSAATHVDVPAGSYVLISVTDTGCGMSQETLAHIFEPFFTTKEPGKGTGLGLATVYGIVEQSRGHVTVESELGLGTTFRIYLPSLDKSAPINSAQLAQSAPRGSGTILLVEDEAALRVLAAEALKRLGYHVLQAGNGVEALAVANEHKQEIHVAVTDLSCPAWVVRRSSKSCA